MASKYLVGLICAGVSIASPAIAGQSSVAPVFQVLSQIASQQSGQFFIWTTATHDSLPTCATDTRWVVDTSTAAGQAVQATILTAVAQGKAISINGTGTCSVWPGTETVLFVTVTY